MRGRLLQPFVLLFSVPRGLSRYDSSFTRVTERRMPPKKKLKALADEKQKMLTDLFSTASIKTSRVRVRVRIRVRVRVRVWVRVSQP